MNKEVFKEYFTVGSPFTNWSPMVFFCFKNDFKNKFFFLFQVFFGIGFFTTPPLTYVYASDSPSSQKTSSSTVQTQPQSKNVVRDSPSSSPLSSFDHSHALWSTILKNFLVTKGPMSQFNYKKLKENPILLNQYLSLLSSVKVDEYKDWKKEQKLAFLINAYNAFTVKLVLDHYPVKSIKDIGGFFSSPWKIKFFQLLGQKRFLDNIEHDIIRKKFNEPRVHFVANCASIGCPKLRGEAYQPEILEQQLKDQTESFLSDSTRNLLNPKEKKIKLSKIFKWYAEDFEKASGSVSAFVAPYITKDLQIQKELKEGRYEVDHFDYDWNLNEITTHR